MVEHGVGAGPRRAGCSYAPGGSWSSSSRRRCRWRVVPFATQGRYRERHLPGGFAEAAVQPQAVVGIRSTGEAPDDSWVLYLARAKFSAGERTGTLSVLPDARRRGVATRRGDPVAQHDQPEADRVDDQVHRRVARELTQPVLGEDAAEGPRRARLPT